MHAIINLEGYLCISTQQSTEGYALSIVFEKASCNSGILLRHDNGYTELQIPTSPPKVNARKKK